MRSADIVPGRYYRSQGGAKVKALETGVTTSGWSSRRDGVRVEETARDGTSRVRKLPSRDIVREWTADDDAGLRRAAERATAAEELNAELGALGFNSAEARVGRDRETGALVPHLSFDGEDAERVMAVLRVHVIP